MPEQEKPESDLLDLSEKKESKTEKKAHSSPAVTKVERFCADLEKIEKAEEKIRILLDFMKGALEAKTALDLGNFWKVRRMCLPFFKEHLAQAIRSTYWAEYLELMKEAQHLKAHLEEEASFAVEQIDLAIRSLEDHFVQFDTVLSAIPLIEFPCFSETQMTEKKGEYLRWQQKLNLYNALAARIHALRKEVIKTGMRLRYKNKFFQRLSACGDLVFPKRRELINQVSDTFFEDVKTFVNTYFGPQKKEAQNFLLKEEIKAFQELAKHLTINTQTFSETRRELSRCWDDLKERDKERKQELLEKKEIFKKHLDEALERIKGFAEYCHTENCKWEEVDQRAKDILSWMRTIELSREDVASLKLQIKTAQAPLLTKLKQMEEDKEKQVKVLSEMRQKKKGDFRSILTTLLENATTLSVDELEGKIKELTGQMATLEFSEMERLPVQAAFRDLEGALYEQKEKECFQNEQDADYVDALYERHAVRELQLEKTKNLIEELRRQLGGSGFGFEQAMQLGEFLENEKARLSVIVQALERIEAKLTEKGE